MQQASLNIRTDNHLAFADFSNLNYNEQESFLLSPYDLNTRLYAFADLKPEADWEYFCNELEFE